MPDGKGGFIINDSVLDDVGGDQDSFSLPPLLSNGFIDFQNQFKVSRAIKAQAFVATFFIKSRFSESFLKMI